MELEVLRAIEKTLGGNLRIQSFFDLIVGTSTGGINALALGVKHWSVGYCIEMFEKFCDQAFTEREFRGVWGLEQAVLLNHGSKYKATPLHNLLRATLGRSPLFGANDSLDAFKIKVAVTATSADGNEATIFANYNRPQSSGDSQTFVRPENPSNELEVWEAAAATSAAPFYFKPYTHTRTGMSYIDGGLYHNNPVYVANRERKLLWPAIADKHPDMLLSIGTGKNPSAPQREALERRSSSTKDDNTPNAPTNRSGGIRRTLNALYQRFDNILDAEHTWTEFEADINNRNDGFPSPYVRLNLELKNKPPPFDAKDKFKEFRADVKRRLMDPDVMEVVKDVACSLVASSFYFKLVKTAPLRGGSFMCMGYICCKFEEGSSNLKALGEFLSRQCTSNFMPEFVIQDTSRCTDGRGVKVKLTEKVISRLTIYGMLRIPHIDFEVPNAMASTTIALVLRGGCQDVASQERWYKKHLAGHQTQPTKAALLPPRLIEIAVPITNPRQREWKDTS
ncbi:FabD/lysophospholipase-like protein [Aureobasidium sp. EXF-12298]|nr:FabD/lysophospholipase-like protein [Aureobasidium sp. EXF-12298]KAI4772238.1 FabD/lysophospholipase-like protein [Aureobasidium sp. EXF-3400]